VIEVRNERRSVEVLEGRVITPILLPVCIKPKQENRPDRFRVRNERRTPANLCPIIFMGEQPSLHSAHRRLRPILGKSSELLNARRSIVTRTAKLDGKLENSARINPTLRVQPTYSLRWKRPAQNSTIQQQSGRPSGAAMTSCVLIEINPIPLLMIRYYCSHFRGVHPRLSSNQHRVYWLLIDYK